MYYFQILRPVWDNSYSVQLLLCSLFIFLIKIDNIAKMSFPPINVNELYVKNLHVDNANLTQPTEKKLGIFWDIENCRMHFWNVPLAVQKIKHLMSLKHPDCNNAAAEFICACDVFKFKDTKFFDQLNKVGANVLHVNGSAKNAADDKLKESIEKFADMYGKNSIIILISGDADFAPTLRSAKRKGIRFKI